MKSQRTACSSSGGWRWSRTSSRPNARHEIRRNDEVAESQRREEHLVEAAGEEHAARRGRVRGAPGWAASNSDTRRRSRPRRRARRPPRPLQEREAPRQAHRRPQRELVRRRDVDEARASRRLEPRSSIPSSSIGATATFAPTASNTSRSTRVAGVLHADAIAGIQEEPRDEIERLLHPGDDRHLLGRALHASRGVQVVRDGLPQRADSPWRRSPAAGSSRRAAVGEP